MLWLQKTVAKEVTMEGVGLHSGQPSRMSFRPAPANSGLFFTVPGSDRQDCADSQDCADIKIEARVENVPPDMDLVRATTLSRGGTHIQTVEHVLSALHGCGITNCEIHLDGGEPPVPGCGSALDYVKMIDEAGVEDQGLPALSYRVNRPVKFQHGNIEITAEPADSFLLTFAVDYPEPLIGRQEMTIDLRPSVYREEIASARTFAMMADVEKLQAMGLGMGGSIDNALIFDNGKLAPGQELRFPDEVVRHKLLDLVGDLSLLGMPIQGHIRARYSGHAANVAFTRLLAKSERKMPRIYPPRDPKHWDIHSIMEIMPHRYPFLLVDRIIELEPAKKVVGIKNVTINEPFFQGHFPGHPIMPAVLITEAMAQTGGVLLLSSVDDSQGKLVYFSGIDNARFRQPVTPGDQLRFELELVKLRGPICKMRGTAWVDGKLVAEADLMSSVVDS